MSLAAYRQAMDDLAITNAAASIFRLIDATNLHIADTAPWALAKDPSQADRLTQVLFDAAEAIRLAAVLLSPIMPRRADEILRRVGATTDSLNFDRDARWRAEGERVLLQGAPLWPRFDKKTTKEKSVSETPSSHRHEPAQCHGTGPRTRTPEPRTQNREPPATSASPSTTS